MQRMQFAEFVLQYLNKIVPDVLRDYFEKVDHTKQQEPMGVI